MSSFPKRAILPCEIKSREFDSKLLLACFLAERGWTSIVGSRNDIHMRLHTFPRSVYLGKDVRFSSATIVKILRLLGHRFVAMDEEALIFLSRERYRKSRVDDYVFSSAEALFAWGPENALAWKESSAYKGQPIHMTGNGRVDFLRPELRTLYNTKCAELKSRYGNFILVNTNFGAINHFMESLTAKVEVGDAKPAVRGHDNGYLLHRQTVLQTFVEMLPALARYFPGNKIVLRPHPSESLAFWRNVLGDCKNIEINSEGSVVPWILASQALVHNGCTTGLEAYILDKITVAYAPVLSQEFDLHLPNDLSFMAKTQNDLFNILQQAVQGRLHTADLHTADRQARLTNFVSASSGESASERMANVLDQFAANHQTASANKLAQGIGVAYSKARSFLKRRNQNRPGHKSNIGYTRHRFPDTPVQEVRDQLNCFRETLSRFNSLEVVEIMPSVFRIRQFQNP